MIVHFGLQLGGMQAARAAQAVGEVVLGPARLIDVLETQLGLPPVQARPAEALLAYQACLADLDGPARFYHRSFAVDPIAAARSLLGWRAEWYEAGWRGRFDSAVSGRLADIAAVEQSAAQRVPLNTGQRLARIAAALGGGLTTQIGRIVLHDEPEALPAAWRAVLDCFACDVAAGVDPAPAAASGTDLHRVQRALRAAAAPSGARRRNKLRLAGDGSLIVLRGVSRDLTAQAIGEYLRGAGQLDASVVIAERDGIIVDNALERVGLARAGFQHYSRFRAVTQVLTLCLGLVWDPVRVHVLLQFLLHPVGPLPAPVRGRLADAVAAEPGVGGRAWREAVADIAARAGLGHDHGPRGGAAPRTPEAAAALVEDLRYWLECERFAPAAGAPIAVLAERGARLTRWLRGRLQGVADAGDAALYRAAVAQGEALIAALASLEERGETRIARVALERLIDEVGGDAPDPATFAEARHVRATTSPATITQPWQNVIWWDLGAAPPRPGPPWSAAELVELGAEGVALPAAAARIRAEARAWRRPVLNARERLILAIHDRDEGSHPLVGQLLSLVEGFHEIRVEDALLAGGADALAALGVATEPLAPKPLPAARRWWTLPADCRLVPRAAESYTSLQKLIDYPHEWVLKYAAKLEPGRAANLVSAALLRGNLAHRLFEMFFTAHADWAATDAAALEGWLGATLPRLVEREGALLTEPGMGVTRERVMATLENALQQLLRHFERARIVRVAAEQWHEAPLAVRLPGGTRDVTLRGAIDLALTDARGRQIVLDVKWGGEEWRGRELARNRHLQLATYAYLRKQETATRGWPEQAYFIVETGNVLAQDTSVFPDAVPFPPEAGGDGVGELWSRIGASIDWRWSQLAGGAIEVNAAGTQPDARSTPPGETLGPADGPDRFDDFERLTGWEAGE